MVRINLIDPKQLSDQHLIAEYREILLLFGYYKKHQKIRPSDDHKCPMRFYHNKLFYLMKRFAFLRLEMIRRGFKPTKFLPIEILGETLLFNDFEPNEIQTKEIKDRIVQRLNEKPSWYRYYGEYKEPKFFEEMMNVSSNRI